MTNEHDNLDGSYLYESVARSNRLLQGRYDQSEPVYGPFYKPVQTEVLCWADEYEDALLATLEHVSPKLAANALEQRTWKAGMGFSVWPYRVGTPAGGLDVRDRIRPDIRLAWTLDASTPEGKAVISDAEDPDIELSPAEQQTLHDCVRKFRATSTGDAAVPRDAEPPKDLSRLFGRKTMKEIFTGNFRRRCLIEGILAEGVNGVISGKFKSQKSHIGAAIAISLATGKPFLGQFAVPEIKRVGYFCGEGGDMSIQWNFRGVAGFYGVEDTLPDNENLLTFNHVPRLDSESDRDDMLRVIEADRLDLIILDPTYLLLAGSADQTSNFIAMGSTLRLLDDISERTGVQCLPSHHNVKGGECRVPELQDLSGAGVAEWAGQWVLLAHREPFDSVNKHSRLWMNAGGRVGYGGLWGLDITETCEDDQPGWDVIINGAEVIERSHKESKELAKKLRSEAGADAMVEKIKDAFRHQAGKDMTASSLATWCGTKTSTTVFAAAVSRMLLNGELSEVEVKAANNKAAKAYHRNWKDG